MPLNSLRRCTPIRILAYSHMLLLALILTLTCIQYFLLRSSKIQICKKRYNRVPTEFEATTTTVSEYNDLGVLSKCMHVFLYTRRINFSLQINISKILLNVCRLAHRSLPLFIGIYWCTLRTNYLRNVQIKHLSIKKEQLWICSCRIQSYY